MKQQNALVQGVSILCILGVCIGVLIGNKITTCQTVEEELSIPLSSNEIVAPEVIFIEIPYIYYDEDSARQAKEQAYRDYLDCFEEEYAEQWWQGYQIMIQNWDDPPEHITDVYTEEELQFLYRCVETETFECDFMSKAHIAMVIFNRLDDPEQIWGRTLKEVITRPNQFAYYRTTISEQTKQACAFAFEMTDMTDGAVAFHSNPKTDTFFGRRYLFTDNCGHHFYR